MINNNMGGSFVSLPYCATMLGLLPTYACLTLFYGVSLYGLHLLGACAFVVEAKRKSKSPSKTPLSITEVGNEAIPRFSFLVTLAVAIHCFGVVTYLLVLTGEIMPYMLQAIFPMYIPRFIYWRH
ncbi:hypothetical protein Pelo_2583 [Pelomyxa schiedti]|nr:hypothetical protein Pelo_2583 [Pelomyxa schiedti]